MFRNNNTNISGVLYIGGGATFSVGGMTRNGWSIANRVAFGRGTSYPVGYRDNAMKLPVAETGQIGATNRSLGLATTTNPGGISGIGSVAGSSAGLATTSSGRIAGLVRGGDSAGVGSTNTPTLAGSGFISGVLNIGFRPSAFDIAQEVWGAVASLNNVIGTMGELLNSGGGGGGGGGGGPSAATIASAVRTELAPELGRIDATVSSRLASAGYTAPANSDISAIKSKTDNLPTDPADNSEILSAISAIPTAPSASSVASQVRTELATELGRMDASVSSRATQSSVNSIPTNPLLTNDSRLNNLDATISSRSTPAQVNTQVTSALNSYDPPTKAELDSAIAGIPSVDYTAIATAVWTATTRSLNVDVTLGSSEITEIANAVQVAIINETDGQQVIDAIVQAIGNENITASAIASQVRTELSAELARIDVSISSRASQGSVFGLY